MNELNQQSEDLVRRNGKVSVGDGAYFTSMAAVLNALGERTKKGERFSDHGIWNGGRKLSDERFIWFPNMTASSKADFVNRFNHDETIIDEICNRDTPPDWSDIGIGDQRIVFAKVKVEKVGLIYKFAGIFKLATNERKHLIWERTSQSADLIH